MPGHALFDSVAKGGYRIMPADIIAYCIAQAVAGAAGEPQQGDEWMPAPQYPYYHPGQKPKLGGVRVSHRHYIHVHLFHLSVFTLFHCIIHA